MFQLAFNSSLSNAPSVPLPSDGELRVRSATSAKVWQQFIAFRSANVIQYCVPVGVELYVENVSPSVFARHVKRNHSAAYGSYQEAAIKATGEQMD